MRKTILLAAAFLALATAPAKAAYQVVSETTQTFNLVLGELKLTETVIQDGAAPINRFRMHRLRRPNISHRGSLLLLPSLGNNFRMYLFSEDGDIRKSFAAFYALLGYDVFGYSPRETGILAGQCGGALDCSPALNWSMQTIVDDVTHIRSRIELLHAGEDPAIGGLSLGAAAAVAVVNQHPADYAGLLAWEGSLVTDNLAIRAHNQPFCNQYSALVAGGVAVDDQTGPFVKLVTQLARTAPNAPFAIPVPGFPAGLTNRQAWVLILSTPNPVAPSPRPGFITAAGDFNTGQLSYSKDDRLFGSIAEFNDVTSNRVTRDLYCSLAGIDTTHTSNLTNFTAPVLIIKAGQGFGSILDELPGKLGSASVSTVANNNFAHVDHLGTSLHWFVLELPVANWLDQVF